VLKGETLMRALCFVAFLLAGVMVGNRTAFGQEVGEARTSGQDRIVTKRLGRMPPLAGDPVVPEKGLHLAYRTRRDNGLSVWRDGQMGPVYDAIPQNTLAFSPAGKRFAYKARKGTECFVVVDGETTPPYDALGPGPVAFSPDGSRFAYAAQKTNVVEFKNLKWSTNEGGAGEAKETEKWWVVTDGTRSRIYDAIAKGTPVFSPDGRHLAYLAGKGKKQFMVVDGEKGPVCDGIIRNGGRMGHSGGLAYLAHENGVLYCVQHIPLSELQR
jgi:hypothetical protein